MHEKEKRVKVTRKVKMGIVIGAVAALVSVWSTNANANVYNSAYLDYNINGYPISVPTGTIGGGGTLVSWNMNGYPAYSPDTNYYGSDTDTRSGVDIVYATGNLYTWSLALPNSVNLAKGATYKLQAWVMPDSPTNSTSDYRLNISANGAALAASDVLNSGNSTSNNWRVLELPVSYTASPISLEISLNYVGQASSSNRWVALDKVELEASPVPIPSTAWLLGTSLVGLCFIRRSRSSRKLA